MKNNKRKGFTLIELLVVIAIIAVLAIVVILSLNPAELLRQARDSNRISDMATLKSAISLYLADQTSPNLAASTTGYTYVYNSVAGGINAMPAMTTASSGFSIAGDFTAASSTGSNSRAVNGGGWIPVNFSAISSGSPLGALPVDPTNSTTSVSTQGGCPLVYGYGATSTLTFKLTAHMESTKFSTNGSADVETPDGGNSVYTYEQGTNLTM